MADDVLLGQRLFDQEQVVVVESSEVLAVGSAIRGVRIDLQRHVGADELAHRSDMIDVGARLDLQLDPHVAVVEVSLDRGEQVVDGVVDAHAHPARDPARPAVAAGRRAEQLGERHVRRAELRVEHRRLDGALRHRMAVHRCEQPPDIGRFDAGAGRWRRAAAGGDGRGRVRLRRRIPPSRSGR